MNAADCKVGLEVKFISDGKVFVESEYGKATADTPVVIVCNNGSSALISLLELPHMSSRFCRFSFDDLEVCSKQRMCPNRKLRLVKEVYKQTNNQELKFAGRPNIWGLTK
jgi:hypothetical protein